MKLEVDIERLAEALFEYAYGPDTLDRELRRWNNQKGPKKGDPPPMWPKLAAESRAEHFRAMAQYVVDSLTRVESIADRYRPDREQRLQLWTK